jgi:hypothetical protein
VKMNMSKPAIRNAAPLTLLRVAAILAAMGGLAACRNLDLGDNPGRDVPKTDKSFTVPPAHLQNGGTE